MFHASTLLALLVAGLGLWTLVVMAAVVGATVAFLVSYGSARLEVTDCVAVRICNTARKFVVTGPTLRHWLPIGAAGRVLDMLCCERCEPDEMDVLRLLCGTRPDPESAGRTPDAMRGALADVYGRFAGLRRDSQFRHQQLREAADRRTLPGPFDDRRGAIRARHRLAGGA